MERPLELKDVYCKPFFAKARHKVSRVMKDKYHQKCACGLVWGSLATGSKERPIQIGTHKRQCLAWIREREIKVLVVERLFLMGYAPAASKTIRKKPARKVQ